MMVLGICCLQLYANPMSVLGRFQKKVMSVQSLKAVVESSQEYRSVKKQGKGQLWYTRNMGIRYDVSSPGSFAFFNSDALVYGINANRKRGWRMEHMEHDPQLRMKIDPLYRLMYIASADPDKFTYRGTGKGLMLYSMKDDNGLRYEVAIDIHLHCCWLIETFDKKGKLIHKASFAYGTDNDAFGIPRSVTCSEVVGKTVAVDKVTFKRVQVNKRIDRRVFSIPQDIAWRRW
jgi:hypothetical protein